MGEDRAEPDETWDAGDVLIVGAGATGLIAARLLAARGFEVTLLEADRLGGGQSCHSHGYLHRGYIYLNPADRIVRRLRTAARAWEDIIGAHEVPYETERSVIAFGTEHEADYATARWKVTGLESVAAIGGGDGEPDVSLLREGQLLLRSPEKVVDFSKVFARIVEHELAGVRTVQGEAVALELDGDEVSGVVVATAHHGSKRLVARRYLLTAGTSTRQLVRGALGHTGPLAVRASFMVALRHPRLPPLSAVFPGQAHSGLFMGSRTPDDGGPSIWLISNHVSFGGDQDGDTAARLWLRHVARTITTVTTAFDLEDLEWAYYPSPKAEMQGLSNLEGPHFEEFGWRNAAVAIPTKLTLVPALLDDVARWAARRVGSGPAPTGAAAPHDTMTVAPELWQACAWYDRAELAALRDGAAGPLPPWDRGR